MLCLRRGDIVIAFLSKAPDASNSAIYDNLYICQAEYQGQFAADVPAEQAALMATTQRTLRDVALNEGAGQPAWRGIPSWFLVAGLDKYIPSKAQRFMAERADAREILELEGASHAVSVSHPGEVSNLILKAIAHVERSNR